MAPLRIAAAAAVSIPILPDTPKRVIWEFLGLHFEAGPLVTGLCGVALVRTAIYLQNGAGRKGLALDLVVFLLCCFVTALWVQDSQMKAFYAGGIGMGVGVVGIGLLGVAKSLAIDQRLSAAFGAFFDQAKPEPLPPPVGSPEPVRGPTPDDMQAILDTITVPDSPRQMPGTGRVEPYDPTSDYGA